MRAIRLAAAWAAVMIAGCGVAPADAPLPASCQEPGTGDFAWAPVPQSAVSLWGGDESRGYAFLFLGTFHNFDTDAPQVPEIKRFFAKFQPTFVMYEGGVLPNIRDEADAIRRGGEMGLAQWLAERCRVRHDTFEPNFRDEVEVVRSQFSKEEAKLYYVARLIPQFASQAGDQEVAAKIASYLKDKRWSDSGLDDVRPRTLDELTNDLMLAVPTLTEWHRLTYADVAAIDRFNQDHRGLLNRVATADAAARDAVLTAKIRTHLRDGDRTFVIAGTSHMLGVMKQLSLDEFIKN